MPLERDLPFIDVIRRLMHDTTPLAVKMTVADVEVMMSILLDMYANPNVPIDAADHLMEFAKQFSDIIEKHHPESEPYLAFIFGAALYHRASQSY